ncbi:MAG TPA: branched-chain amino acid ABC transporter substrate-binding protein [Gaiellaceae bacterium]|nr:branched-chain amino acid ABC transporter substrate-binding protein [Gaiellaceae bacterium]
MTKRILLGSAIGTALTGVVLAVAVGGAVAHTSAATPLPASSCTGLQGTGDKLIASDLPLQGAGRTQTIQMTKAIAYILGKAGWKAGNTTLAYQSCDDATAQAGKWDSGKVSTNGNAYAQNSSLIGVIGTFNSGAAEILIPILNRAPNGPVAMISPANTYVGLTHSGPGTAAGEPNKYYPTGKRNYARVVAADDFQGAADATLAKQLGITKVFILNDKEAYGLGVATNFRNAAVKLGIKVVGFTAWDGKASSYEATALKIAKSGAQGVFLGGLICENGGKLIKDLVAGAPKVKIMAPDGFTPISADVQQSGGKAEGMTVSVAGLPVEKLPAAGKAFGKAFCASKGSSCVGGQPDPYSVYAAAAAQVMLTAIGASDGSRAGVADQLFKVKAKTVLGTIQFNKNGDVTANPVTIYKVKGGKSTTFKVIVPANSLVAAA